MSQFGWALLKLGLSLSCLCLASLRDLLRCAWAMSWTTGTRTVSPWGSGAGESGLSTSVSESGSGSCLELGGGLGFGLQG